MTSPPRGSSAPANFLRFVLLVGCAAAPARLAAGIAIGQQVTFELREGSTITDECVFCDRAPITRPLIGTFIMTRAAEAPLDFDVYQLTEISWRDPFRVPGQDYVISGTGTYRLNTRDGTAVLNLELEVTGTAGVNLASTPAPETSPWPALDVTVTEDGTRDEAHRFTIRVLAAPVANSVPYQLLEGSALIDECTPCGRQAIVIPLAGGFTMGQIAGTPFGRSVFRIDGVFFEDTVENVSLQLTGNGTFRLDGEIALFETMDLELALNTGESAESLRFVGGPVMPGAVLPAIDMTLKDQAAVKTRQLTLRVVAEPIDEPPPAYRRGDANADGHADISDGIFILGWRFLGGRAPSCLDAADTNDDDQHDLTDAVFILNHLFQGGPPPPAPGLESCGQSPNESLGCESFPACSG